MRLPAPVVGVLTFAAMLVMLLAVFLLLLPGILLHCVPVFRVQRVGARLCVRAARWWVRRNHGVYRLLHGLPDPDAGYGRVRLPAAPALDPRRSYLLLANHQSWADILILFDVFGGRVPLLRFFLKKELIWVPIVGVGCWAMDFPFMKRHSREAIARNPQLASEDLETTRRACAIYRLDPVTLVNFPEGTRFTPAKRDAKGSPYRHLLRPKAAGLSFTLDAMGEQFADVLDVTLRYRSTRRALLWSWLCGEQAEVRVDVRVLPVPAALLGGDYAGDAAYRERFQAWLNGLWADKDARLAAPDAG